MTRENIRCGTVAPDCEKHPILPRVCIFLGPTLRVTCDIRRFFLRQATVNSAKIIKNYRLRGSADGLLNSQTEFLKGAIVWRTTREM